MTKQQIPRDRRRDITYGRIVCEYRSEKKDPYLTRIKMGGNLINYPGDCGTSTADLLTVKLMFNSIISTPNAKFMTIDIKDFYLMTPMDRFEYLRMKLELFPQDIIEEYGLRDKVDTDGNVFCEVRRGMYGLPQAGIIAQELLTKRLHQAGYRQSTVTPGYWRHEWRPISFTLVVDDFGEKYINKTDVDHLTSVLSQDYQIDMDWEGTRYLGLTLDWDYKLRKVHLHAGIHQESLHQIWPHNARQATTTTTPPHSPYLRCNHPVCQTHQPITTGHEGATKIHSTSHWSVTLLRTGSRFHTPCGPQLTSVSASGTNRTHHGTHQMAPRLCCNQPRRHPHIQK